MPIEYIIPNAFLTPHCVLGEGPTYLSSTDELYYLDIPRQYVSRVSLSDCTVVSESIASFNTPDAPAIEAFKTWTEGTASIETTKYPEPIGVLCLVKSSPKQFLVGARHGFAIATFGVPELKYKVDVYTEDAEKHAIMRFNDGNVDPAGRFLAGTMVEEDGYRPPIGTLYRLEVDGTCAPVLENCQIPNGLCWSADTKTMFHSDSPSKTVWAYDYDVATGTPSNKRALVKIEGEGMVPDGMTISAQGDLFIAVWGGAKVVQHDSMTGECKAIYHLPGKKITCPVFGGKDLDELFVTSAAMNDSLEHVWTEADGEADLGGEIFRFKVPGHSGVPRGVWEGEL
ncbi:hypothetical protein V1512DRAFT_250151 [Lipomyces arxii]|uniref:uncharacterized protein n=1 Tax=Lipomyces arxii TaxID=56418 RepID=UPI0034CDDEA1